MNITNAKETPYFDRLPRYALPALQAAWEKARERSFGTLAIFTSYCRDMDEIGFEKPSKPIFSAWVDGVQKGTIPRPDGAEQGPSTEAQVAALSPATLSSLTGDQPEVAAMKSMRSVRDMLVTELVDQFTANARRQAETIMVGVLRDLAAEMEKAQP